MYVYSTAGYMFTEQSLWLSKVNQTQAFKIAVSLCILVEAYRIMHHYVYNPVYV